MAIEKEIFSGYQSMQYLSQNLHCAYVFYQRSSPKFAFDECAAIIQTLLKDIRATAEICVPVNMLLNWISYQNWTLNDAFRKEPHLIIDNQRMKN